jgi:putative membrane protein
MKPLLHSFSITPVAAALFLGGTLLAVSGCKKNDNAAADTTVPADTVPPASSTSAMPADTTTANGMDNGMDASGMPTNASSANAMAGADTGAMAGASSMDALASGPVEDTQFYTQAMLGGQKEIAASQLVEQQGSNADVKKAATKIESDHKAFGKKVQAAAAGKVTPPAPESASTAALDGKTGADLDQAYVDEMVTDHQKTIAMFENAAKNASTPEAKKLAEAALPTLRDHLKMAQDLQQKLGANP